MPKPTDPISGTTATRGLWPGAASFAATLGLGLALVALIPRGGEGQGQPREVSPEVLQAIRLLLSKDPKDEARGEHAIRRLGPRGAAEIRSWIDRIRGETNRVEAFLAQLEGRASTRPSEGSTAAEFLGLKAAQSRTYARRGEWKKAQEVSEAVLLLDPQNPLAWELRRIIRTARERIASRQVLEPSIDVGSFVYEVGEKPEAVFRISNHENKVARVYLEKGILGDMDLDITRQAINGSMRRETHKLRIQVPEDVEQILIGPGQSWETTLDFDTSKDFALADMVGRVQVGGRFRPTRWTVEKAEENFSIGMPPLEFWIVPPGEKGHAERPLEKLTAALVFGKLEAFFVAGQICVWVGEGDPYFNELLVDTLISGFEDLDESRRRIATRLLSQATGQKLGEDVAPWKAWWQKLRGGPTRVPPPAKDEELGLSPESPRDPR